MRFAGVVFAAVMVTALAASGCARRVRLETAGSVREVESTLGEGSAGAIEESWCGSSGRIVRLEQAQAIALAAADAPAGSMLWLRVACPGGGELELSGSGVPGPPTRVVLPDTLHKERFEWVRAGALAASSAELKVAATRGSVALDQWAWLDASLPVPPPLSPRVWTSAGGSIELRAAARAQVVDPEWTMQLAREQRDVVGSRFDARLRRPLVLIALPAAEWPKPGAGAFQNGCVLFLRDDELHLPWRGYAHEISHLFEDELPAKLPWFLSEGIACALALEVEKAILGAKGPVAEKEAQLDRLLADGDAFHRPGSREPNPAFELEADPTDAAARASAYAWSTALLREIVRRGGSGSWRRLWSGLEAERGTVPLAAAERLLRDAAQVPIDDLLLRVGWPRGPRG